MEGSTRNIQRALPSPFLQTLRRGGLDEIRIHEKIRGFGSREPKGNFFVFSVEGLTLGNMWGLREQGFEGPLYSVAQYSCAHNLSSPEDSGWREGNIQQMVFWALANINRDTYIIQHTLLSTYSTQHLLFLCKKTAWYRSFGQYNEKNIGKALISCIKFSKHRLFTQPLIFLQSPNVKGFQESTPPVR